MTVPLVAGGQAVPVKRRPKIVCVGIQADLQGPKIRRDRGYRR
jgi:hypothetical protein